MIEKLPASLALLKQLKELKLGNNKITTVPASIGELKQLETLSLEGNALTIFSEAIFKIGSLKKLAIPEKYLTPTVRTKAKKTISRCKFPYLMDKETCG